MQLGGRWPTALLIQAASGLEQAVRNHFRHARGDQAHPAVDGTHVCAAARHAAARPTVAPLLPCACASPLAQGTGGLSLLCSARICELYSLASGAAEPSYVCSLRGTPAQPDHAPAAVAAGGERPAAALDAAAAAPAAPLPLWELRHTWPAGAAPRTAMLRLLSLAEPGVLRLQRWHLLPATAASDGPLGAAGAPAAAASTDESAAGVPDVAPVASQMDDVRLLVARLAAEGPGSSSGEGPPDPRRALLSAIAKQALQPPTAGMQRAPLHQGQPDVAAALQRLEERVGRLEALCTDMHGMLRQLLNARVPQDTAV